MAERSKSMHANIEFWQVCLINRALSLTARYFTA